MLARMVVEALEGKAPVAVNERGASVLDSEELAVLP